jgi:hypothetical protein
MKNKDSLYFCLVNKELQRLYTLIADNSDTSVYSSTSGRVVDLTVRNWAMERVTELQRAMISGPAGASTYSNISGLESLRDGPANPGFHGYGKQDR